MTGIPKVVSLLDANFMLIIIIFRLVIIFKYCNFTHFDDF